MEQLKGATMIVTKLLRDDTYAIVNVTLTDNEITEIASGLQHAVLKNAEFKTICEKCSMLANLVNNGAIYAHTNKAQKGQNN